MAVYKALRGESSVQFVETARKLAVHTRFYCLKMSKRYTFFGVQELCRTVKIDGKYVSREFAISDIYPAYSSWRSHMQRGNNYWRVQRMDAFFQKLFGFDPANAEQRREVLREDRERSRCLCIA